MAKQTIELFSGTMSFSKVAKQHGFNTFTLEKDISFEADLHKDILEVTPKDLPKDCFVLWASPPCTSFSVASIGKSWIGNYCPRRVETALGIAYVLKTIDLIRKIKPTYWFIENPRGVLRKMAFMQEFERHTITYCQYGDTRMKPTDIWTNCEKWTPRPVCKNGDKCHSPAPRGSKAGTQGLIGAKDRSVIPPALFNEIFSVITNK